MIKYKNDFKGRLLSFVAISDIAFEQNENSRVIETTDIGGTDPNNEESTVHVLIMANNLDIEGVIYCQMASCHSPISIANPNKITDAYTIAEQNQKAHDAHLKRRRVQAGL